MSNTIIQVKRSTSTSQPVNGSLSAAEPAYSYVSDKLFLGNSTGDGVITVGGKFFVDQQNTIFEVANAAFAAANGGSTQGGAAFLQANSSYAHANGAFIEANSASAIAAAAFVQANSSYAHANGAFSAANSSSTLASGAFLQANSSYAHANGAFTHANGAFEKANSALMLSGGTITGDLVVQGNATFSGMTTYANTQTLLIGDNIITLNADIPADVAPSENAGIEIKRGTSANVSLLWNEAVDAWVFTNDGTTYKNIASNTDVESATSTGSSAFAHANGAFVQANSSYVHANAAFTQANGAFTQANSSYAHANGAFTHANGAFVQANTAFTNAGAAFDKANTADTNAANASFLSVGTVPSARISGSYTGITGVGTIATGTWNGSTISVPHGGTGRTSANTNGIVFGNGTEPFGVTAAGTEGQVLQVSVSGVPQFGTLDGGNF